MMVSSESQGAWWGGGGGAGLVTWHAGLCVAAVLRRVGSLVHGGPAWRWSGVVWVEVTGGMGLAGITTGWRLRGFARGVVVTSRRRGGVMSERKKRKKKKGLNKVGSRGRIVAVGGGVGMTSRRCFRAGSVGGNVGQSKQKGLVGSELAWWWAPQIALRVLSWRILYVAKAWHRGGILVKVDGDGGHKFMSARPSSSSSCVLRRHGVGAELSRSGVPVVEIDGDGVRNNTKKKKPLPISSSSAVVLGGFTQWGDDGGELEAMAGAMG
ncbi:hypothetical protein EDB89DRAFT_1914120 [Lactarius sanguifluus]|nr:hypothetical protein EDB89DRAFT_1914120 [Lactarius sanguifluus]